MRSCFICSSAENVNHYAAVDSHDYVRCSHCGLIYVDNVQPTAKLYHAYDGGMLKAWRRKAVAPYRGFTQVRNFDKSMARANRIFDFVASLYSNRQAQPTWLDIGCNKGFLLAAAIAHNWNVYGVELVPELMMPFQRKFKQFANNIFSQRFIDVQTQFHDNTFDVISAIDVIEHFEEPRRDMSGIYRILKTGGLFVAQTPDGAAPQARESKERWGALKSLEHLHIFNATNLEIFAKQLGFAEIKLFPPFEEADGNLVAVMKK
ncbi:class I SAM-dependent methyltransferase [candidate division KSB1 bacterium]|nr:class I SAM-dependent methyltransferase [candidate division KSB1 bacterium]